MSSIELELISVVSNPKGGNQALSIRIRGPPVFGDFRADLNKFQQLFNILFDLCDLIRLVGFYRMCVILLNFMRSLFDLCDFIKFYVIS